MMLREVSDREYQVGIRGAEGSSRVDTLKEGAGMVIHTKVLRYSGTI